VNLFDRTDFEGGFNGWQFKSWMPNEREARAELVANAGVLGTPGVRIYADGRDDDGIFFLEKTIRLESRQSCVAVSWLFADFNPSQVIGAWPRVVYVGPPRDLARPETQHELVWLRGSDRLLHLGDLHWNQQCYMQAAPAVSEMQICVGWKIQFETERFSRIDSIVIAGLRGDVELWEGGQSETVGG
jgi:hypothetical protein